MNDSTKVQAVQACERLLLELADLTDHGPYDQIAELFTEDGEFDRDGTVVSGREALRDLYAERPASLMTRHMVSNVIVTMVSEREATSQAYATVYRYRSSEAAKPVPPVVCHGPESVAEYQDHLVRTPEGWKLRRRVLRTIINVRKP
jgi:3-phenylpropionate/cinnamic acid dioxygenase small subunit